MKPNKLLYVIPECFVDTNLIEYLLNAGVNHQHCCSKVVGQLNSIFADRFAIGIIDKDKVQLGYVKECAIIAKTEHITLMKHRSRHQYLFTIAPAEDKFVLDCAHRQSVCVEDFGLPEELKKFTDETKKVSSNSDQRFKALFAAIKENSEIRFLKMALKYLCENQFSTHCEYLRKLSVAH